MKSYARADFEKRVGDSSKAEDAGEQFDRVVYEFYGPARRLLTGYSVVCMYLGLIKRGSLSPAEKEVQEAFDDLDRARREMDALLVKFFPQEVFECKGPPLRPFKGR